jgi:CheY-like chemotaxis protein
VNEQVTEASFSPNADTGFGKASWMLSTVAPMVEALGGTLDLRQYSGSGIAVSILVPAKPETVPAREAVDAELPILVVEDDAPSRFFTESILLREGHLVETAARGREALSRLEEQRFSLVLLDIQLPDVDGVLIAEAMRKDKALNQRTPVIAVTAHATPEYRQRYEEAGIDRIITKPFKVATLRKAIESYLGD